MSKKISKQITYWLGIVAVGLVAGLGIQFVQAAWSEPTSLPPVQNVAAPVNVSVNAQYKSGALGIGQILRGYNTPISAIFDGNVGIGTVNPGAKLDVSGNILASGDVCTGAGNCLNSVGSPHGRQDFTSNGVFTVPAGVTKVYVTLMGGGGGGGGGVGTVGGGSGGGGGKLIYSIPYNVTPSTNINASIGAGGARALHDADGQPGAATSFGTLTAGGGAGGIRGANSPDINGGDGGTALSIPAKGATVTTVAEDGLYAGCGGGGGTSNRSFPYDAGGNGHSGVVTVEW